MRESYRQLLKEKQTGLADNFISLIFVGNEHALDKDFLQMKSIIKKLLDGIKC